MSSRCISNGIPAKPDVVAAIGLTRPVTKEVLLASLQTYQVTRVAIGANPQSGQPQALIGVSTSANAVKLAASRNIRIGQDILTFKLCEPGARFDANFIDTPVVFAQTQTSALPVHSLTHGPRVPRAVSSHPAATPASSSAAAIARPPTQLRHQGPSPVLPSAFASQEFVTRLANDTTTAATQSDARIEKLEMGLRAAQADLKFLTRRHEEYTAANVTTMTSLLDKVAALEAEKQSSAKANSKSASATSLFTKAVLRSKAVNAATAAATTVASTSDTKKDAKKDTKKKGSVLGTKRSATSAGIGAEDDISGSGAKASPRTKAKNRASVGTIAPSPARPRLRVVNRTP